MADTAEQDEAQKFRETLIAVWRQVMEQGQRVVELDEQSYPVTHTRAQKLRQVRFRVDDHWLVGIEQNPKTQSRWAKLAREGHRLMQFLEEQPRRYLAVVVDGRVTFYGGRH